MLCESTDGGCNVDLEPCMGRSRERHADRLKRMTLEAEATSTLAQVRLDKNYMCKSLCIFTVHTPKECLGKKFKFLCLVLASHPW